MAATDDSPRPKYRSYLLRIWMEDALSPSPWRIALINPHTGKRRGFTHPDKLAAFLMSQMDDEQALEQESQEE